jgi:hypothetical protein
VLFFLTGYAIILYLNQPDPQPRERDYSYVGSFFAFALWVGIGLAGVLEWIGEFLKDRDKLKRVVYVAACVVLFAVVPLNLFAVNFESHDRSGNFVAYDYSYNILETCEPNAIVFTNGDNDTFPLWFLQEVYGIRRDVRVVNLSLLNTPWYIKQLRDKEPKLAIRMSDKSIDNIFYRQWKEQTISIPVPGQVRERMIREMQAKDSQVNPDTIKGAITFKLSPKWPRENPQVLRVQDIMVLQLINWNQWERPVYFAVTVSRENQLDLFDYMRMDGLAYKVVPFKVNDVDSEILSKNLMEKYQYRNMDNPDVFYNVGITKLLINMRQAFIQLARHHLLKGEKQKTLDVLHTMEEKIPHQVVPYSIERVAATVAYMYKMAGEEVEHQYFTDHVMKNRYVSVEEQLEMASYYFTMLNDADRAESMFGEVLKSDPDNMQANPALIYIYRQTGQYEKGIQLLESWLLRHPRDPSAQRELDAFRALVQGDTTNNDQ